MLSWLIFLYLLLAFDTPPVLSFVLPESTALRKTSQHHHNITSVSSSFDEEPKVILPGTNDNAVREARSVIGQLKGAATLLAAFSFASLKPCTTDDVDLFMENTFVVLDCLTLGFELLSVFAAQQLLWKIYDGSFGVTSNVMTDDQGNANPLEKTVLGLLILRYPIEFGATRGCFLAGIFCLMGATIARVCAEFPRDVAVVATIILSLTGMGITAFAMRTQRLVFSKFDRSIVKITDSDRDGKISIREWIDLWNKG